MQLSKEQQEIVDLKKWAYQQAYEVARENASSLTQSNERRHLDGEAIQKRADEIFKWVTTTA